MRYGSQQIHGAMSKTLMCKTYQLPPCNPHDVMHDGEVSAGTTRRSLDMLRMLLVVLYLLRTIVLCHVLQITVCDICRYNADDILYAFSWQVFDKNFTVFFFKWKIIRHWFRKCLGRTGCKPQNTLCGYMVDDVVSVYSVFSGPGHLKLLITLDNAVIFWDLFS